MRDRFILLIILLGSILNAHAAEIGGISMPDLLETEKGVLMLNGAGIRTKFSLSVYVAGLYLRHKNVNPEEIIAADEPMAIRLHVVSAMITSDIMSQATREGFSKTTDGNITPIQPEIDMFITIFSDKINKNDVYDLVYIPAKGVTAYKNNKPLMVTTGLRFKQALFGIWLCDNPVHQGLKKALLGR
ncbi:MAG: chalcone isomerase family protein [Desulfobacterales bacterium]|nr:chalcone isomerase family protein [Desulfobacterales bacterium]